MKNFFPIIALIGMAVAAASGGSKSKAAKPKAEPVAPISVPSPAPHVTPLKHVIELLDFGASWCGPCRQMKSTVDALEARGVKVNRIDADQDKQAVSDWGVSDLPTFIAVRDGKEIGRIVGLTSGDALRRLVNPDSSAPSHAPAVGPKGFRLRLFYPQGDSAGEKLAKMIPRRMPVITKNYGFDHDTTTSVQASSWVGIPKDKLTLMLVDASDRIVYYQHDFPHDTMALREELQKAKAGEVNVAGDCPSCVPTKPASTQ